MRSPRVLLAALALSAVAAAAEPDWQPVLTDLLKSEKTGFGVGDRVSLLTTGPRVEAEVVGVFRLGDGGSAGASLTAFDVATAQEVLGEPGQYSGISIAAQDGVSPEELGAATAAPVLGLSG